MLESTIIILVLYIKKTGTERLHDLSKVTELVVGKMGLVSRQSGSKYRRITI